MPWFSHPLFAWISKLSRENLALQGSCPVEWKIIEHGLCKSGSGMNCEICHASKRFQRRSQVIY